MVGMNVSESMSVFKTAQIQCRCGGHDERKRVPLA